MSIRNALLALLSEGPRHGLGLQQEFEARTGEVWPLNVGQVYTTLQRLERDGAVVVDEDDGTQRVYRITESGSAELESWLHTPAGDDPPPRDELVIKVLVATRVPGIDVHAVIQSHRRRVVEVMQHWTRLKGEATDDLGLALVLDAELFRLDAVARWLDAADARLRRSDRDRPAAEARRAPDPAPAEVTR